MEKRTIAAVSNQVNLTLSSKRRGKTHIHQQEKCTINAVKNTKVEDQATLGLFKQAGKRKYELYQI